VSERGLNCNATGCGPSRPPARLPQCPQLCRFSDAGMPSLSTRCGGRRLKSAKAGNRGGWGTGGAAGSMGIWLRGAAPEGLTAVVGPVALRRRMGARAGVNERTACCAPGIAMLFRSNPGRQRKRRRCRRRAGRNGAFRCGGGSAMTAS
jgi:hypothetical protein